MNENSEFSQKFEIDTEYTSDARDVLPQLKNISEKPLGLYHVTTAMSQILEEGLKSRQDLNGAVVGLGGAPGDTVSLTYSKEKAYFIENGLKIFAQAVRGDLRASEVVDKFWKLYKMDEMTEEDKSFEVGYLSHKFLTMEGRPDKEVDRLLSDRETQEALKLLGVRLDEKIQVDKKLVGVGDEYDLKNQLNMYEMYKLCSFLDETWGDKSVGKEDYNRAKMTSHFMAPDGENFSEAVRAVPNLLKIKPEEIGILQVDVRRGAILKDFNPYESEVQFEPRYLKVSKQI